MSSPTGTAKLLIRGNPHPIAVEVLPPFEGESTGVVDVPSGSVSTDSFSIPFGTISSATVLYIKNRMPVVDCNVKLNGSTSLFRLPTGGVLMVVQPAASGGTPLSSAAVLPASTTSGAGFVDFLVLGDPV